jgi:hypothetical protein
LRKSTYSDDPARQPALQPYEKPTVVRHVDHLDAGQVLDDLETPLRARVVDHDHGEPGRAGKARDARA